MSNSWGCRGKPRICKYYPMACDHFHYIPSIAAKSPPCGRGLKQYDSPKNACMCEATFVKRM